MFSLAVGIERHAVLAPLIDCGCTYGMGPWFGNAASEQEFLDAYAEDAALPAVHPQWVDGLKKPILRPAPLIDAAPCGDRLNLNHFVA